MAIRTVTQGLLNDIQEVSFEDGVQVITVRFDNGIDVSQTWKWSTMVDVDGNESCLHDVMWKHISALGKDECFELLGKMATLISGASVTPFDGAAFDTNGGTMAEDLPVQHPEEQ